VVCALAATAGADTPTAADVAFKKGRELLKAGKFAEACAQFEQSQALDPQLGTQFNIAQCDEKIGKLAAALALYREIADKDTNGQRRSVAIDLAARLDKRVPHVQLQVEPVTAPVAVKLGDQTVACARGRCDARVDRGHYTASATAKSFRDASAAVDVPVEGATVIVKLVLVPEAAEPPPKPPEPAPKPPPAPEPAVAVEPPPPEQPAPSHRKRYAIGAFAVGGASLATGVVFGVLARSAWNDAKAACGNSTACPDSTALARANSLRDTASSRATLSTAFVLGGAMLAGTGLVLWLTAPSEHAVSVTPTGNGVVFTGRF
jgi:hypothetical protein